MRKERKKERKSEERVEGRGVEGWQKTGRNGRDGERREL